MTLDNRPKKLLVKGVRDDSSQALKDWYEVRSLSNFITVWINCLHSFASQTTGYLESIEPTETSGTYIVTFKSRLAAETVSTVLIRLTMCKTKG